MIAELATYVLSAPVAGSTQTSIDGGTVTSPVKTSGRVLTCTISVVNGAAVAQFSGVDQSQQAETLTSTAGLQLPASVTTPLLAYLQSLGQAKITAVAPGTTITFTAG
jgi:hypothetical protein